MEPTVSVVALTYNHAAFLAHCLDSILAQQVGFPYEVVLHDDASTDGTTEIVRDYAARYPDVIRPIIQAENQYSKERGRVTRIVYGAARGKYIALCEGDDYWTDPMKLQKQVDAMEADPQAVGCFTDAWNEQDGVRTSYLDGIYAKPPASRTLGQREMVLGQNIPTCTFLFRRDALFPLPDILNQAPVGDTVLYVHLTAKGHIRYLPVHTAVRAMHPGGVHSQSGRLSRIKVKEKLWPLLDGMTGGRYKADLERMLDLMYPKEWEAAMEAGDQAVLKHIWPGMLARRRALGWSRPRTAMYFCKARLPRIGKVLSSVTGR